MKPELEELLEELSVALDDWVTTYASDWCDSKHVRKSWHRIMNNGGTIAYASNLIARIRTHKINEPKTLQAQGIAPLENGQN